MGNAFSAAYARHKRLRETSRGYRVLVSIVEIIVVSYVAICVLMLFTQRRLIYFPTRDVSRTPRTAGLAYEDVELTCPSGVRIDAWFVPAADARGTILFCHGNGGNITYCVEWMEIFNRLGFNVLAFDYRGYGKSAGTPTEEGTYEDALTAWNYLTSDRAKSGKSVTNGERVVIFGHSLGSAVAAWLAARVTPGALVVESAFTSVPDLGARLYPWLPVRLLARYRYSTIDYIRRVRCPILVAHSPEDEIVPYALGRRVFDAAPSPKEFLEMRGDHNEGFMTMGDAYPDGLNAFLSKYFGPDGPSK